MFQYFKHIVFIFLSVSFISSCQKNTDFQEISFSAQLFEGPETKSSGQYTATDLNSLGQFKVNGFDGDIKDIDSRTVYKTGSIWKFNDNPKVWISGHTRTFWADANMPSWASVVSDGKGTATMSVSSIPASAENQWDPLVGYYSGTGINGRADIVFYHPFTAVTFKTGEVGDPAIISSINSVSLVGVHQQGTVTVSAGSPLSYTWATTNKITVSGAFSGNQSAKPFLLIPQKLNTDNITISIVVSLVSGGTSSKTVVLSTGEWNAGIHYTYTLDYIPYTQMEGDLKVTLTDWEYLKSASGKDFFDASFDE